MKKGLVGAMLAVALLSGASLSAAVVAGPALAAPCPNEALRTGLSASLPACRAYEKVTPSEKGGVGINRQDGGNFPAGTNSNNTLVMPDGISFVGGGVFAGSEAATGQGVPYYSLRGPDGWSTTPLGLPVNPPIRPFQPTFNLTVSDDGTRFATETSAKLLPSAQECREYFNCTPLFYLHDTVTGTNRLITRTPLENPTETFATQFIAANPDLTRVIFNANARLTPEALSGVFNAYEWIDNGTEIGELKLLGYEPGSGTLFPAGAEGGTGGEVPIAGSKENRRVFSLDGRHVVFTTGGQLYVRVDGTRTIAVSASQRTPVDPEGRQPATYRTAEATNGSAVYFTSEEKLTDDSKAVVGIKERVINEQGVEEEIVVRRAEADLYRFDVATEKLTDITVTGPGGGGVLGVIGASSDGNSVYFAATGQLVPGQGAPNERNIYLWRNDGSAHGSLTYVTTIAPAIAPSSPEAQEIPFEYNWWPEGGYHGEQVSENGRYLVLITKKQLTGYPTGNTFQVYRYDAGTGQLLCASCDPNVPASTERSSLTGVEGSRSDKPRSVSDSGVVGFMTTQALSPDDTNGLKDVYLFEGGAPRLISSGKGSLPSSFLGTDASGRDFYFITSAQMVNSDTDELVDIYDAREGGGIAEPTPTGSCGADCRGSARAPAPFGEPGTRGLEGAGNLPRDCTAPQRQAKRLRIRAKRLSTKAKRAGSPKQTHRIGKRAAQLRKQSHRLDSSAKRCIATNRRAGK